MGLKKSKEGLRLGYEQAKIKRGCKIPEDWSKLEKMYIEEKLSVPEISRRTVFTQGIIYARFRQIGILRSSNESQKLLPWAWKEEDKERLRQVYHSKPKDEVLRMFPNRTWNGIAVKARRLKVKRPYPPPHHPIPLEKADDATRAYLGGILDGEGTISVHQTRCGPIAPLVCVTNTDEELIKWIGRILDLPYYSREEEKHKTSFSVRCSQIWKVHRILELLEPYLRIKTKKTLATLVMDFCRRRFEHLYMPYMKEDKDTVIKIRELNQRGIKLQKPIRWAGDKP